jgi:hypothetical protein
VYHGDSLLGLDAWKHFAVGGIDQRAAKLLAAICAEIVWITNSLIYIDAESRLNLAPSKWSFGAD